MLFKSLVKAAFVASALAQPVQRHQHHQHDKRAVVTQTVVVTLGADGAATTLANTYSAAPTSPSTTIINDVVPSASVASSGAVASSSSTGSSGGSFSGAAKAITYSPYADDGQCKSASAVASDIAKLSAYSVIRLYGVDCSQVENVMAALGDDQKVFLGIFDVSDISGGVSTMAAAVKANGGWGKVYTVSIGNELVNAGSANPSQIKSYVEQGKSALKSAGYTGPVVSVDTFIAIINNPDLCDCSDYIAANAHAFFDGNVAAEDAGSWVLEQIQRLATACPGKNVFITESGWPTKGDTYGKAVPGSSQQAAALASISSSCGNDVTFFTAFNDYWKADGYLNVEKYWGIIN